MVGEVQKMVTVGLVWGATNALMRKGAIKWDETIKSLPQPNTHHANSQELVQTFVDMAISFAILL